jgi:hypothetical protein
MSYYVVDVEADGPVPGLYSMVCFGAVKVDSKLDKTFYAKTAPITEDFIPEALAVSGFSREQHVMFDPPSFAMKQFDRWLKETSVGQPILISDNNGFDAMFIAYYFHKYLKSNPFGWSSRRIGDIYCGLVKDSRAQWKHLRETKHTHHPVDDAKGNAEALLKMQRDMGLKIKFE